MGIFSYIQGSKESTEDDIPLRSKREQCWEARDLYNTCLDKIKVENPLDPKNTSIINKNCSSQDQHFQANCAKSWVEYFKEKRYVDIKRAKMLEEVDKKNAEIVNLPGKPPRK